MSEQLLSQKQVSEMVSFSRSYIYEIIAQELTQKLRKKVTVDWQKRESVRASIRIMIRLTLKRHKYPPDEQKEAIDLVMKQTEALGDEWALAS